MANIESEPFDTDTYQLELEAFYHSIDEAFKGGMELFDNLSLSSSSSSSSSSMDEENMDEENMKEKEGANDSFYETDSSVSSDEQGDINDIFIETDDNDGLEEEDTDGVDTEEEEEREEEGVGELPPTLDQTEFDESSGASPSEEILGNKDFELALDDLYIDDGGTDERETE